MKFNEYQAKAIKYDLAGAKRDLMGGGFVEKVLGLAGEAGETADKFKKIIRDRGGMITDADKEAIVKELGDILWYVSAIAEYLDVPFDDVAQLNLKKAESRRKRNALHGEGDDR
ncbi:nucleoside triphosphate pyrophosphohydrolase family protein [Candidatus Saccharibacteria bacterium]|nr:nucleoside triphosphate pyrophosphohydrolase family protein [Candidatus Saccharibacteria bacterium]MBQ3445829.1 nucleoside triphosphate pyrophosphohydrolase family protein [Candidatus Saccharibacteria bacterium]MBQ6375925.1 nucleoside triphosphate pyrophosphohydrolase family protein [Candidatus Saccharibacteria bacterium]